jgi:hypothetical protein
MTDSTWQHIPDDISNSICHCRQLTIIVVTAQAAQHKRHALIIQQAWWDRHAALVQQVPAAPVLQNSRLAIAKQAQTDRKQRTRSKVSNSICHCAHICLDAPDKHCCRGSSSPTEKAKRAGML